MLDGFFVDAHGFSCVACVLLESVEASVLEEPEVELEWDVLMIGSPMLRA